jgi:DedD protein
MEEGSKRRLIGATVVVVLVVIFVPMLLDEGTSTPPAPPAGESGTGPQPRPEMDAEFRQPLKPPPLATITELPPPDLLSESERGMAGAGQAPVGNAAVRKPATDASKVLPRTPEPQPSKETAKPAPKEGTRESRKETAQEAPKPAAKESPKETPKSTEPPPMKTGTGWIFQVASLTERAKADAMAGNLKSKGFPAFVEEAEVNGRTYYRVRVGPRKERKDIDALAASVRDKTGQSGQIQRY